MTAAGRPSSPLEGERMNRILWNRRDGHNADIDEIVVHNCTVHIEQMNARDWWIGITLPNGDRWMGDFYCDSRGLMGFWGEADGEWTWDEDESHEDRERMNGWIRQEDVYGCTFPVSGATCCSRAALWVSASFPDHDTWDGETRCDEHVASSGEHRTEENA